VRVSRITIVASNSRRSARAIRTSFMLSMTWLLVITSPSASTSTPEPRDRCARSPRGPRPPSGSPKKRRMNSSMALVRALERLSTWDA
jgi:hypothetical protein